MTKQEKKRLIEHEGHDVHIVDFKAGEPIDEDDGGRFCLECRDCSRILLGDRVQVTM